MGNEEKKEKVEIKKEEKKEQVEIKKEEKKEKVEIKKEEKKEQGEIKKEEKKEKVDAVIVAGYKVNLHCPKCAHDIRKPLLRTPGVQSVDVKFESSEIIVKGAIDEKKIHQKLEKWSKKKVEIIPKDKIKVPAVKEQETKKETVKTTIIKAYMHCDQCERDLRTRLIKHKGIHNVKTDRKAQTITIEGTIESEKLLTYMRRKVHKQAEIVLPKKDEKKEKDEVQVKTTEIKQKDEKKEKVEVQEKTSTEIKQKDEKKEKVEVEAKTPEIKQIVEFKEEKKVEAKTKDGNVPYFVHYVYAPQLFSDENPNACSIM